MSNHRNSGRRFRHLLALAVVGGVVLAAPGTGAATPSDPGTGAAALPSPVAEVRKTILDGPASGRSVDTVDDVVAVLAGIVEDRVRRVKDAVEKVGDDGAGRVRDLVNPVVTIIEGLADEAKKVTDPDRGDGDPGHGRDARDPRAVVGGERIERRHLDGLFAAARNAAYHSTAAAVPAPGGAGAFAASEPGVAERIAQGAVEAAKKLAFPLALVLLVGAFVVVQGRIDARDPKLALAPVDGDQELLSFT